MKFFKYKDLVLSYRRVFGSEEGKVVLNDLIKSFHILGPTFSKDPYEMAFREGGRNVVLKILHTLNVDPNKIQEMIDASKEEEI